MRTRSIKCIGIFVFIFLMDCLWAQNPLPKSASKTLVKKDTIAVKLDESWDPMSIDELINDFTTAQSTGLMPVDVDRILKGDERDSDAKKDMVPGFRVQLVATRDEGEARQARTDALFNFMQNVYLMYDNPYYKLRLGDCLSHVEADSLQQLAIDKGFVSAWIVRTMVYRNPVTMSSPSMQADTTNTQR